MALLLVLLVIPPLIVVPCETLAMSILRLIADMLPPLLGAVTYRRRWRGVDAKLEMVAVVWVPERWPKRKGLRGELVGGWVVLLFVVVASCRVVPNWCRSMIL